MYFSKTRLGWEWYVGNDAKGRIQKKNLSVNCMPTESSNARAVHKPILEGIFSKYKDEEPEISYDFISCLGRGNNYLKRSDESDTFKILLSL